MKFATFYKLSTGYVVGSIPPRFDGEKKPVPALGSDGVAIFDGRFGNTRCADLARDICRKRGFIGFQIEAGSRFTDSHVIRRYESVSDRESN